LAGASGDRPIIEAFARLVALLDTPEDIGVMAPLVRREIFYRVLSGKLGPSVRALMAGGGSSQRIAKVIALLHERYREPLRIREMAEAVNLSESGLAHSFKAATRMSPVQFQKRLRLHEARRLMLSGTLGAQTAGYRVGYESPSQFSRDYRRLFGSPPAADIAKLRNEMA
jgi:transcriptional regulator GlxA family with amidase domain